MAKKSPYKNVYPSLTVLYEQYSVPHEQIIYEDKPYKFVKTIRKAEIVIDIFRNEEEQHTVKIYLVNKRPYYIDTYYWVRTLYATV